MFFPSCLLVDIAGSHPGLAVVLEEWGLDYGRAGGQTLQAACTAHQLDLEEVCQMLERAREACPAGLAGLTRAELVNHVRQVHHDYLRRHLPVLQETARNARRFYGAERQELHHVDQIFQVLADELQQHLDHEEKFAFPWVGSQGMSQLDLWMLDSLAEERRKATFRLKCLRFLTNHYTPPDSAGESMRRLYNGLRDLDRDYQRHVYVEERYLFNRQQAA